MKFLKYILAVLFMVTAPAYAADTIYAKDGLANKGYDVVAYFSLNANDDAIKGSADYAVEYEGYTYHFASQENLDLFKANPNAYLPAYGGYCAYAVGAKASKAKVDPNAWSIVDGVLYLNYNASIHKTWRDDQSSLIEKANTIWPTIKDQRFKKGWF